jgi:hypothetical protein
VMRIDTQGLKNKVAKTQGLKRCLSLTLMEPFEGGRHLSFLNGYTPSFLSPGDKSGLLHLWNSPNATTLKKRNVISPTLIQLQQLF